MFQEASHPIRHMGHPFRMNHLKDMDDPRTLPPYFFTRSHAEYPRYTTSHPWSSSTTEQSTVATSSRHVSHRHPDHEFRGLWDSDVHYLLLFVGLYVLFLVILALVHRRKKKPRPSGLTAYEDYLRRRSKHLKNEEEALIKSSKSETSLQVDAESITNMGYLPDSEVPGQVV